MTVLSNDLAEALAVAGSRLNGGMKYPNLFLLPARDGCATLGELLRECLGCEFPISFFDIAVPQPNEIGGPAKYLCLAVDSSRPERVRDAIKERLWATRRGALTQAKLHDILQGRHERTTREFRLEEYGIFVPCRTRRFTEIRTHSFEHEPAFYRYRVALARVALVSPRLADYLHALFTNCPNHLFRRTVFRASGASRGTLGIEIPLTRVRRHDIVTLAGQSRGFRPVKSGHENLQKFFLEHDPGTIACEVPVWMESWEFADYRHVLRTSATLTGHIDVLRYEDDGRVGVWDYKPRAAAERNADIQVFLYALMLAVRTGLPLTAFLCGYFDEKDAYVFRPSQVRLTGGA